MHCARPRPMNVILGAKPGPPGQYVADALNERGHAHVRAYPCNPSLQVFEREWFKPAYRAIGLPRLRSRASDRSCQDAMGFRTIRVPFGMDCEDTSEPSRICRGLADRRRMVS